MKKINQQINVIIIFSIARNFSNLVVITKKINLMEEFPLIFLQYKNKNQTCEKTKYFQKYSNNLNY